MEDWMVMATIGGVLFVAGLVTKELVSMVFAKLRRADDFITKDDLKKELAGFVSVPACNQCEGRDLNTALASLERVLKQDIKEAMNAFSVQLSGIQESISKLSSRIDAHIDNHHGGGK